MAQNNRDKAGRARGLCRQLAPVIGPQKAARIWTAYVMENEAGRDQILEYLELLAAQHFQGSLDDEGPGLIPPKAEAAAGEYALGTVAYNGKPLYPFGLREPEVLQHLGVFGRSGGGKTNLGFLIVQRLVEAGKPVLIFDWKRNYRDLAALPGFEKLAVYTAGRPVAPLRINPLMPPPRTSPEAWIGKVIAVMAHAYLLGDGVIFLLREAIDAVYVATGVYSGRVEQWPTFRDVFEYLRNRKTSGREAGWMSSALRALGGLCFGEMNALVNNGHDRIEDLLVRSVVLELDALAQSEKVFITSLLIQWIHNFRLSGPVRESLGLVLLIEEAHHLLSDERRSLSGGQSVMELAFREIREFGVGIVMIDQRPATISPSALANTYALICFSMTHRADVSAVSQAMLLDDENKAALLGLQVGEAVVRLQGRSTGPFLIRVPEYSHIKKGQFSDTMVAHQMTRLGLLSARDHAIQPRADLPAEAVPAGSSVNADASHSAGEQAFFIDVATFPDGGIAERYKRLGWSVRQGQKVKAALIRKGLISEEIRTTPRGKIRIIRLTEQAKQTEDYEDSPTSPH